MYVYVYNEWMEWMFLFTLLYVYCLIMLFKQDDKYIYINLNVKSKSVKREEESEIILQNPVWVFCFDYIGCFVRVY